MLSGKGAMVGVVSGAGIPSRRRHRRSTSGAGVQVVQRMRCSTWTPAPGPLRGKLADVTGYPLFRPASLVVAITRVPAVRVQRPGYPSNDARYDTKRKTILYWQNETVTIILGYGEREHHSPG